MQREVTLQNVDFFLYGLKALHNARQRVCLLENIIHTFLIELCDKWHERVNITTKLLVRISSQAYIHESFKIV